MSFPQHTVLLHWKSCWYTVSIFHPNLTLENTITIVLSLSYLDKKLDIRVSVLTVSGHDAWFWLSPWFFFFFLNYSPLLILGGLHPPEKKMKNNPDIFSEIILSPLTVIPHTFRSCLWFLIPDSRSPSPFWSCKGRLLPCLCPTGGCWGVGPGGR